MGDRIPGANWPLSSLITIMTLTKIMSVEMRGKL